MNGMEEGLQRRRRLLEGLERAQIRKLVTATEGIDSEEAMELAVSCGKALQVLDEIARCIHDAMKTADPAVREYVIARAREAMPRTAEWLDAGAMLEVSQSIDAVEAMTTIESMTRGRVDGTH